MLSTPPGKREPSPPPPSRPRKEAGGGQRHFATCPRGLEPPLLAELELLGAEHTSAVAGGVAFVRFYVNGRPSEPREVVRGQPCEQEQEL